MKLLDVADSIDLKIKFKYRVGNMEAIHYQSLTSDMNPELFSKIIDIVKDSLNKDLEEFNQIT